jgi:phage shock protein E
MGFLSRLLGFGPKADFQDLIKNRKAQIIDVRTSGEFKRGNVKGSKNIPLSNFQIAPSKLKKDRAVILCCASGARSASATRMLKAKGFEAYNGGSWNALRKFV